MNKKPIVNLDGDKFDFKQKGKELPMYIVYAKNEQKAIKELTKLVSMFGLTFEDMERV